MVAETSCPERRPRLYSFWSSCQFYGLFALVFRLAMNLEFDWMLGIW
ncbi:MAG: hypothetical protein ACUVXJ_02420 [Phycisphaerae bacterium]